MTPAKFDPTATITPRRWLSIIHEIKRQAPKHISELGIKGRRGVANIKAVWNEATEAERDYWSNWYYSASHDVQELADDYDLDVDVAAAVVATLSPGNKWLGNLAAADHLIRVFREGGVPTRIAAYPENVKKAWRILEKNKAEVSGPKVMAFYNSLVDPSEMERLSALEDENGLVIDSHAINIWRGKKSTLKDTPDISDSTRRKIKVDYLKAALELGTSPQALQAVTWYIWKYTTGGDKGKRMKAKFKRG